MTTRPWQLFTEFRKWRDIHARAEKIEKKSNDLHARLKIGNYNLGALCSLLCPIYIFKIYRVAQHLPLLISNFSQLFKFLDICRKQIKNKILRLFRNLVREPSSDFFFWSSDFQKNLRAFKSSYFFYYWNMIFKLWYTIAGIHWNILFRMVFDLF